MIGSLAEILLKVILLRYNNAINNNKKYNIIQNLSCFNSYTKKWAYDIYHFKFQYHSKNYLFTYNYYLSTYY